MIDPDMVFSLGPNCRNTWNIRDYFKTDIAYPFDWWITPAKSMLAMLDPKFEFSARKDDLFITDTVDGNNSVYSRKLNLLHHHDFDRVGRLVQQIDSASVDKLNSKYRYLFARFRQHISAARRPLAIMNQVSNGWTEGVPSGGFNTELNGAIRPQAVVDSIRKNLGEKVHVLFVVAGEASVAALEGGTIIHRPDRGVRENLSPGQGFAEPVHVYRDAFQALNLRPGSIGMQETAVDLSISNNIPVVLSTAQ